MSAKSATVALNNFDAYPEELGTPGTGCTRCLNIWKYSGNNSGVRGRIFLTADPSIHHSCEMPYSLMILFTESFSDIFAKQARYGSQAHAGRWECLVN